jgi:hypothetical protein
MYLEIDVLERWSQMLHLWRLSFFTCSASAPPFFLNHGSTPRVIYHDCMFTFAWTGFEKSSVKRKLGVKDRDVLFLAHVAGICGDE